MSKFVYPSVVLSRFRATLCERLTSKKELTFCVQDYNNWFQLSFSFDQSFRWYCAGLLSPCARSSKTDRLVGLVVRRPPRERKVPGSNPACAGIFSGSSHTCDLNIGTPVATLPGAWYYRVSTGTGWPGVSIL